MQQLLHAKGGKHKSGVDVCDCTLLAPTKSHLLLGNPYAKCILCIVAAMPAILSAVPAAGCLPSEAEKQAHQLVHLPTWMPQVWELLPVLPP